MLTDLKYALRMLIKAPVFAVIAILTLALGIGANSAIFSVIDTVLLRPLPFKNPDEIVHIWGRYANDSGKVRGNVHSFPDYVDLRDQSQSFAAMAAYTRTGGTLSLAEDAKALEGIAITPEVFDVLGVQPLLGRGFTKEDAKNEADRVVVLTYPLWKSAFGSDPKIIGQKITISARPHTVIGVMPPGWKFPVEDEHIDYALPLEYLGQQFLSNRGSHFLTVVGRLKPGVADQDGGSGADGDREPALEAISRYEPELHRDRGGDAAFGCRGRCSSGVVGPSRRGCPRPAHRVRECGEPSSGAGGFAQSRDRYSNGARRESRARCSPTALRKPVARGARRVRRLASGLVGRRSSQRGRARKGYRIWARSK